MRDNSIPKHRKKKKKKSPKKSNHKHLYEIVIGKSTSKYNKERILGYKYRRCSVCDKLDFVGYFTTDRKVNIGHSQLVMEINEVVKEFPHLEVVDAFDH